MDLHWLKYYILDDTNVYKNEFIKSCGNVEGFYASMCYNSNALRLFRRASIVFETK